MAMQTGCSFYGIRHWRQGRETPNRSWHPGPSLSFTLPFYAFLLLFTLTCSVTPLRAQSAAQEAASPKSVQNANAFAGADAGAKIAAALASLPPGGGTVIANFPGKATLGVTLKISHDVRLELGAGNYVCTVDPCFQVGANLILTGAGRHATSLRPTAGGLIFSGAGIVRMFRVSDLSLEGAALGSRLLNVPAYGAGADWRTARIMFTRNFITGFGAHGRPAIELGQSVYFWHLSDNIFSRNYGALKVAWASDGWFEHNNVWSQLGGPGLSLVGGGSVWVAENDFELNAGGSREPDILLDATPSAGQSGFIWIRDNKFGTESEDPGRYKIRVYSPERGAVFNDVRITGNNFGGARESTSAAVKLDSPVKQLLFDDNKISNFPTIIEDNFSLPNTDLGASVFGANNRYEPPGGNSPTSMARIFKNGGRGFSLVARSILTDEYPSTYEPRDNETPELRNRIPDSEDLRGTGWSAGGVTVAGRQSDPYGTLRASRLTAEGRRGPEYIVNTSLSTTDQPAMQVLTFWGKAGSLDTVEMGLSAGSTQFQGSRPVFKLGPAWRRYKFTYRGTPGTIDRIYVYPGTANVEAAGDVYLFGLQVSDYDSDYYPTHGSAASEAAGNRWELPVIPAGGIKIGAGAEISKFLSFTFSLDFSAPPVPGCLDSSPQAAPGVKLGDTVVTSLDKPSQPSQQLSGFVNAPGQVTFRVCQFAGPGTDPDGSGATYRADVWQH